MLKDVKDAALGLALRAFINERLGDYGEVTLCRVNTRKKHVTLNALLDGEKEVVTATLEGFDLEQSRRGVFIVPRAFNSSRPWLTRLLNALFAGKRYALPPALGALLQ
ncbi:MAG: hypothetical protein ACRESS_01680 [Stenotrophobium sp.]